MRNQITQVPLASVNEDPATPVEIPPVQVPRAASPAIIKPPSSSGSDVIPGRSSNGKEGNSTFQELTTDTDDSDDSAEHVNDRIANQFAELERDQAAIRFGLGLMISYKRNVLSYSHKYYSRTYYYQSH